MLLAFALAIANRVSQGRVHFGGALSGRDQNAVNKTVSGLLKLLFPNSDQPVPDEDLEWAVGSPSNSGGASRNSKSASAPPSFGTRSSVTQWVSTGSRKSSRPLNSRAKIALAQTRCLPGRSAISPGGQEEGVGLYRIEVNEGPGGGGRILNQSPPPPFRESVKIAEQNLYARSRKFVGDRNPREHEFTVQLRSFDASKTADQTGVPVLVSLASGLLGKPLKGGMAVVGGINLGGSIEPVHNPIDVIEHALSKGAATVLVPVSCRRALVDLSDEVATKVQLLYYSDAPDALRKALHEG